jgi:carbonic anhydrase
MNSQLSEQKQLTAAVEANVRWSMHLLLETTEGQNATKAGARLVGAIYEIASGHVRFLP